jgi:hypothetical protein
MGLRIQKPITNTFKGVNRSYSSFQTANGDSLRWYMVSRDTEDWSGVDDDMKNLFKSFGLAREDQNDWFKALGMVQDYYNAKRMLIISMDESLVGSYIDGSTLRINIPTGTSSGEYVTFYGSTFIGENFDNATDEFIAAQQFDVSVYGSNYCYLFANTSGTGALPVATYPSGWHIPYSGSYDGEEHPNSSYVDSWVVDSTQRSVPHLRATHWSKATDDGQDVPYGIAFLEKGLFVLFDIHGRTDLLSNIASISGTSTSIWTSTTAVFEAKTITGGTAEDNTDNNNRKEVYFTGTNADASALISYRTIDHSYKMIFFCHAGQDEFNSTTNHTYNHTKAWFTPNDADSIYVTEIALYDESSDSPLAYAKLSEPVEKNVLETLTFKVELDI